MKNRKTENFIKTKLFAVFSVIVFVFLFTPITYAKEINLKNTVDLVNQSRIKNNLNTLYISTVLVNVAKDKARDMITHHYFSHTSPQGISPWYWFKKNNYNYEYAGENLAINYTNAEEQHQAWMNSPSHRKNILNPNYTEIGVATARGYIDNQPAFITVQVFGKPQTVVIKNQITNNPKKQTLLQSSVSENTFNFSPPTYLQEKNISSYQESNSKKIAYQKIIPANNAPLLFAKKHIHNFLWLIILILGIVIIRDMVLSTINSSFARHHSTTNLILLLMLWSILVGI